MVTRTTEKNNGSEKPFNEKTNTTAQSAEIDLLKGKRPRNFDEFLSESIKKESTWDNMKYLRRRDLWIKESKTERLLDKIPSDELPHCEQIDAEHSRVGDFIDKGTFEDVYDDDEGEILDGLDKNGVLCYSFNDVRTWWKTKLNKEKDGIDGLIRIR